MSNTEPTAAMKLGHIAPFFLVGDVVASAEYYRDTLGFMFERYWGDPPCFVIIHRDGVFIMLQEQTWGDLVQPNYKRTGESETWDAYIWLDGVDAYYDDIKAKGATILSDPYDTAYDCRETLVADPDGYRICFGQNIDNANKS